MPPGELAYFLEEFLEALKYATVANLKYAIVAYLARGQICNGCIFGERAAKKHGLELRLQHEARRDLTTKCPARSITKLKNGAAQVGLSPCVAAFVSHDAPHGDATFLRQFGLGEIQARVAQPEAFRKKVASFCFFPLTTGRVMRKHYAQMSAVARKNYRRLKAMLVSRGHTLRSFALARGYRPTTVYSAASGARTSTNARRIIREIEQYAQSE